METSVMKITYLLIKVFVHSFLSIYYIMMENFHIHSIYLLFEPGCIVTSVTACNSAEMARLMYVTNNYLTENASLHKVLKSIGKIIRYKRVNLNDF